MLQRPVEPRQYTSIAYTERLAAAGIDPSVGSVGDAYDNALAESVIGSWEEAAWSDDVANWVRGQLSDGHGLPGMASLLEGVSLLAKSASRRGQSTV